MSAFSLILALMLEQFRPISRNNRAYLTFIRLTDYIEQAWPGKEMRYAITVWLVAVLPAVLLAMGIFWLLCAIHPLLGWIGSTAVLYLTMGFRQFSHAFTDVSDALRNKDLASARTILAKWTGQDASEMSADEISRIAIEQGTVDSHSYVFGPIFWFILLAPFCGPAGVLLYRLSGLLRQKWDKRTDCFRTCAVQAQYILDWMPARLTAVSFAVVGDFEDAIYCWRTQAEQWSDRIQGILLASVGGALGVCLGSTVTQDHTVQVRPELGIGEEASPHFLRNAVGLIWRTVLLWITIVLMIGLITWIAS